MHTVGRWVALGFSCVVSACGGSPPVTSAPEAPRSAEPPASTEAPSATPPPLLVPVAVALSGRAEPMDGTCTIAREGETSTFRYEGGRLVASDRRDQGELTRYAYEGERLVRAERTTRGSRRTVIELAYDEHGRLVTRSRWTQSSGARSPRLAERVLYAYDADGRLHQTVQTTPPRTRCEDTLDDRGRMTSRVCVIQGREDEPPYLVEVGYDDAGRVLRVREDDVTLMYRYDTRGLLVHTRGAMAGMGTIVTEQVEYDDQHRAVRLVERSSVGTFPADIQYDGSFGAGAQCGALTTTPPGVSVVMALDWLGIEP